jgi:MotA/TolQ/ExbB proton channel family
VNVLSTISPQIWVPGTVLGILILWFLTRFLIRGIIYCFRLGALHARISATKRPNLIAEIKKAFEGNKKLAHLWNEYRESLHMIKEERDGQMQLVDARATVPADTYFNTQYVVDGHLGTEFFKHFPGIFTGIGIIGTFYGLILGLSAFHVSEDPNAVRASLETLMHHVGSAFVVSAFAICAAMVITLLEKLLLARLYRHTEHIAQAIDAKFVAGAGEEYLSRLVKASEDSASQSKILKDALVQELGNLLRELTTAQIDAFQKQQSQLADRLSEVSKHQVESAKQHSEALATSIAGSIEKSLQGPMEAIANSVKAASGDQSQTAVKMMQDVMVSFSQKLDDMFGGQISKLSNLNQDTSASIQAAVGALQTLVSGLEESSRRSTDSMADRMAQAMERMETRQESINAQSQAFVEQIKSLVASSQSETNAKLQSTLENIGTEVASMLQALNQSQRSTFESHREREEQMVARTSSAVDTMSGSIEEAVKEMSAASSKMAQNVELLSRSTSSSIDKISTGADALNLTLGKFTAAGESVSQVLSQVTSIGTKLSEASGALSTGGSAMRELIADYQLQRNAIALLVTELKTTVEAARKEASLTGDVLARIQSATERLSAAQVQADSYLEGVSRVLGEAHSTFATEVKRTLDKANSEFHTKLSSAVGLLSSSIEELSLTLESAPALAGR